MKRELQPPPGWQARLDRLMAIYERACNELRAATGMPAVIARQKARVAYRQIQALLALRPPARSMQSETMFADLERQVALEAERQRALAPSNDNGTGASKERDPNNGTVR